MTTSTETLAALPGFRTGLSLPTQEHERIPTAEDVATADRLYRDAVDWTSRQGPLAKRDRLLHALRVQLVIEQRRVAHLEKLVSREEAGAGT